jgi:proteasome lid subunit RPN8/RPN11
MPKKYVPVEFDQSETVTIADDMSNEELVQFTKVSLFVHIHPLSTETLSAAKVMFSGAVMFMFVILSGPPVWVTLKETE